MSSRIEEAIQVVPTARRLNWQRLEFIGFIHFGINTFNDVEWGQGHEDISIFNPAELDAEQWVLTLQSAGMKGLILTCKHHDGFCLWPSRYSEHTIKNTPYKDGNGDIVREVSEACKKHGMRFGVYLSPWDMTDHRYGQGRAYDDYFVDQLTELLTNYGDIFEVWFDGANGEGPNGKVQQYDWKRYYEAIRKLQPEAVIAIMGPDVRWVGNEAGNVRENEWSVVPIAYADPDYTAENSQKVDDGTFSRLYEHEDEDLGSREVINQFIGELVWYPAETDTSIRPGWFYHENEDHAVRSSEELFDIYKKSVGGNSVLLLNIPPNKQGLIPQYDSNVLKDLGEKIAVFNCELANECEYKVGENIEMLDVEYEKASESHMIEIKLDKATELQYIVLQEDLTKSQRIEKVSIELMSVDSNITRCDFGTVGYKKIIEVNPSSKIKQVNINIEEYRGDKVYLSKISLY